MARWSEKPAITAAELAPGDQFPVSDTSEAVGARDKTITVDELQAAFGGTQQLGVGQTGHGLSVGDVARHDGSDWVESLADTTGHAVFGGLVIAVPDSDSFLLASSGFVSGLSGLTAGSLHYLQDAGGLGLSPGTVTLPVLLATSTTTGVIITAAAPVTPPGAAWGTVTGTLSNQTDLQTALDAKLAQLATVQSYGGNRTLDASNAGAYVRITAAGTVTLPDSLATGFQCVIVNATTSDTVELDAATTLILPPGFDPEVQNRRAVTVIHIGSDVWEVHGALEES